MASRTSGIGYTCYLLVPPPPQVAGAARPGPLPGPGFLLVFGYGRGWGGVGGRGPAGADLQSWPGVLPGRRGDQAGPGPVLPVGRGRHRARAAGAAVHAAPV